MKSLLVLSILSVSALLSELFNFKKRFYPLIYIGLILAAAFAVFDIALINAQGELLNKLQSFNFLIFDKSMFSGLFNNMLEFDEQALYFMLLITVVAFFWFIMARDYIKEETGQTDHYALLSFALIGAYLMCAFSNMVILFLGIEILSLSVYVLVGSKKTDLSSNEAGLKYFLMGSFATGFLLLGIALVYGATGSFNLDKIGFIVGTQTASMPQFFYVGVLLMLIAMAFKISAVPFHFWAPDVYQGAPTPITAFMSTIVKAAAMAALMRVFYVCFIPIEFKWINVLLVLSVLTMLVGNITAAYQTSAKRMLAYSSVAHAGYMLIPIVALVPNTYSAVLYYSLAYSFASIIAFTVLMTLQKSGSDESIHSFEGLAKRNPLLAFAMAVSMLSLAGIPPLAGFFAKYFLFTTALQVGLLGLVICAVLASLVGVYFYFKIIIAMYFKSGNGEQKISLSLGQSIMLICLSLLLLGIGLFPDGIIRLL